MLMVDGRLRLNSAWRLRLRSRVRDRRKNRGGGRVGTILVVRRKALVALRWWRLLGAGVLVGPQRPSLPVVVLIRWLRLLRLL